MKKLWIDNNIVFIVETCNNKYVGDQKKGRRREGNKKGKLERKRHILYIYVDVERVLTGHMGLITLIGQCIKIIKALE